MFTPVSKLTSTALYQRTPSFRFDLDYYLSTRIPLCLKYWKPHGVLDCRVVQVNPDQEFVYVVTMTWKDETCWEKAKAQEEEMKEIMQDVKVFTDEMPVFVVGRVVL
jgi:hypothetical protein